MSAVAEEINITKPGVGIVSSEKESRKSQFLVPRSNHLVAVDSTKTPSRAPSRIQFGMLRNRALKMIAPITLELERKGATVVARWNEAEEFGYGRNISEAVDDFGRTLEELYFSLKEKEDVLSDDLLRLSNLLRIRIRESRR